jgi:hypothetical protein
MDTDGAPEHSKRLAAEAAAVVDPLLADVWSIAWQSEDPDGPGSWGGLAVLLRMAYLQGYGDALREEQRGEVFRRLGVNVPEIRAPRQRAGRSRRSSGSGDSSDR